MSTIAEKLIALTNQKIADHNKVEACKTAIGQFVIVPNNSKLGDLPDLINAINPTLSGNGVYKVRFIDPISGVIKTQFVNAGESATPPIIRAYSHLTFDAYIGDYTNIQSDIDIGVNYKSTDGYTRLFLDVDEKMGFSFSIYLTKTDTSELKIVNDETNVVIATTSDNGDVAIPITFAASGKYILKIETTSNYSFNNNFLFGDTVFQRFVFKNIHIGNKVTSIGVSAFNGCSSLASVVISTSVTSIGVYAFFDCSSLSSVVIPSSVTSIGMYAFFDCSSLSSVVIPSSVTSIEMYAFNGCSSLSKVVIPASLTSIEVAAFNSCSSLASVVISTSVTSIGVYAFNGCRFWNLTILNNVPPTLADATAIPVLSYLKIYVPADSVNAYKTAPYWSNFASQIFAIS